ncbi:MAG: metal ABC transporter permease, partial [Bdellovibrionales bacterium]|nr:metal ABC transporter permease [Bdellovibrionales bacterium]
MYLSQFIALDLPPLLTAIFSASACALLGTYLLLRKQSMMGDAISHSVLPGIVVAFLLTSSRGGFTIFVGAAIAGLLSAVLIELTRRFGSVESGAAMGVVFSLFFAAGIVILEQAAARSIDLDADCLLHGQLESIFWYPPTGASSLLSYETIEKLPIEVWTSFITLALTLGFILVLFKELQFASFDPALASASGFSSTLIHHLLMAMVACAVVASFKAVGSILVIAMIICPAACARLCTDKLVTQLYLSVLFAVLASILGYFSGAFGPILFGFENSVNAAGMIAVTAGILLGLCVFLAPRYGVIAKNLRRLQLQQRV